ncbi:hypothetical protein HPB51_021449 [Rhipicephalus microplus]|uniref:Uncharacterized protein n=1 Tax=Rhipicephalus microplus TaxID=6941 RepID=A0A9J6DWC4_RHIMP|nr:hypothetical protein HPB51_021449 [Rhipicephalus microplus]
MEWVPRRCRRNMAPYEERAGPTHTSSSSAIPKAVAGYNFGNLRAYTEMYKSVDVTLQRAEEMTSTDKKLRRKVAHVDAQIKLKLKQWQQEMEARKQATQEQQLLKQQLLKQQAVAVIRQMATQIKEAPLTALPSLLFDSLLPPMTPHRSLFPQVWTMTRWTSRQPCMHKRGGDDDMSNSQCKQVSEPDGPGSSKDNPVYSTGPGSTPVTAENTGNSV